MPKHDAAKDDKKAAKPAGNDDAAEATLEQEIAAARADSRLVAHILDRLSQIESGLASAPRAGSTENVQAELAELRTQLATVKRRVDKIGLH